MLPNWFTVFRAFLIEAWSVRRGAQVRFLKLQVELLRQKLPGKRVILAPDDRERLLRAGEALDHHVDDVIGIVAVKTYRRWVREKVAGRQAERVGGPRIITASLRGLILRMARENVGWGVRRILGELRKLALTPNRRSVRRLLVSARGNERDRGVRGNDPLALTGRPQVS